MFDELLKYFQKVKDRKITSLFDQDKQRATNFSVLQEDMFLDFSKTNIDQQAFKLLSDLAKFRGISEARDEMFKGELINTSESRAVLHTALRNLEGSPIYVDKIDIMPSVLQTLEKMKEFSERVRSGQLSGQGGAISDVVNIGIGGSDLGPAMVVRALAPYHNGPKCHFISNVDGSHIHDVLSKLNPETTLVIIASKTFTTSETMKNAQTAYAWMSEVVNEPSLQFVAVSTAVQKTDAFGISRSNVFGFEDWVGGRYSIWGPIGLSIIIAIGGEAFVAFLNGAHDMDMHFKTAEIGENLPILLALVGIWHNQICNYSTRAVLPYDQRLGKLPAYLQQLEMESNGKGVDLDGNPLNFHSAPVVWGEAGTNGQHAFFQLLHQGTRVIPCEFLVAAQSHEPYLDHHHKSLLSNCFAQSEALMQGRSFEEVCSNFKNEHIEKRKFEHQARHRVFPGSRPSTTLLYPKLTPRILGKIIALYEHRVFVEGKILGINSFDQWGVELGKDIANGLETILVEESESKDLNTSTQSLIKVAKTMW
jgi:glucose-6-phosphate isomerase